MRSLTPDLAGSWLEAAVEIVGREYPNAPQLLLRSPDDLRPPHEVHPAFHGALDWHSCVHMHWSIARLLRRHPHLAAGDRARETFARHLAPGNLETEAAYLRGHPTFERPYGWAWAMTLVAELDDHPDPALRELAPALAPLRAAIVERWTEHLPRASHPQRAGTHANTAFAMIHGLAAAGRLGEDDLAHRLGQHAQRHFLHDVAAPTAYEPSGEDFLSPTLTEAHLLAAVLGPDDFHDWFERFLPGIDHVIPPSVRDPVEPLDPSDWRLVHLHGLTLSRAWSWRAIARALPQRDERRVAALDAADRHLATGLDHVLTGGYGGDHWLVSFALLAVDGIEP